MTMYSFARACARCSSGHSSKPTVPGRDNRTTLLTIRERQVLQLIAEGKSTKEIATRLGVTAKTARIPPHASNAKAGHPRNRKPSALRGATGDRSSLTARRHR